MARQKIKHRVLILMMMIIHLPRGKSVKALSVICRLFHNNNNEIYIVVFMRYVTLTLFSVILLACNNNDTQRIDTNCKQMTYVRIWETVRSSCRF